MNLLKVCSRVTTTAFSLLLAANLAEADDDDLVAIYERLGVRNYRELPAPEITVDGDELEFLRSEFVIKGKRDKKSRKLKTQVVKRNYQKSKVTFQNALGLTVTGVLFQPSDSKLNIKPPLLIYHHSENTPNPVTVNELQENHSGHGKDKRDWQWIIHFMNQGYTILSIDAPGYGYSFKNSAVDFKKVYGLTWEQVRLYNDLLAYLFFLDYDNLQGDSKSWDTQNVAVLGHTTSKQRSRALVNTIGAEYVYWAILNRSQWPHLDVFGLLARLNAHLYEGYLTPRVSENFRKEMLEQRDAKKAHEGSCQKNLVPRVRSPKVAHLNPRQEGIY